VFFKIKIQFACKIENAQLFLPPQYFEKSFASLSFILMTILRLHQSKLFVNAGITKCIKFLVAHALF